MLNPEQRKKKQKLIRYVIGFCLLLIPVLAYLQKGLLKGDFNLPISSTVLIFALININGLLLLLMLYLVLRNLVELIRITSYNVCYTKLLRLPLIKNTSLNL